MTNCSRRDGVRRFWPPKPLALLLTHELCDDTAASAAERASSYANGKAGLLPPLALPKGRHCQLQKANLN
jgi:hypothetical protein